MRKAKKTYSLDDDTLYSLALAKAKMLNADCDVLEYFAKHLGINPRGKLGMVSWHEAEQISKAYLESGRRLPKPDEFRFCRYRKKARVLKARFVQGGLPETRRRK